MDNNLQRKYKYDELVGILGDETLWLFTVNINSHRIFLYQKNAEISHETAGAIPSHPTAATSDTPLAAALSANSEGFIYEESIKNYLINNILPQEIAGMRHLLELDNLVGKLRESHSTSFYYRIGSGTNTKHRKIMCVRLGDAENFKDILFAVTEEQIDVRRNQMIQSMELDDITRVYTRSAFMHHAETIMRKAPDAGYDLVLTDIENFRRIKKDFGQPAADRLLKYLANAYVSNLDALLVGRYSGDQFIILADSKTSGNLSKLRIINDKIINNSPVPYLVIKYGMYSNINKNEDLNTACYKATLALNSIKHKGDRILSYYDKVLYDEQDSISNIEASFERAINNDEFELWFQPQRDTHTLKIVSAECLVRWRTPSGEMIKPDVFIPIFEADGKITRLDEYIFDKVCEYQRRQWDNGSKPLPISVNVSRVTFHRTDELKVYERIISKHRIPKNLVPVEITETGSTGDGFNDIVCAFKEAGFEIHMDDFGSGYSSLSGISELPIDVLKLDKTLIDKLGDKRGNILLKHIIELAHSLNFRIIAEGVENEEQYEFLREHDCDIIQGYLFNKAMPSEEYFSLLNNK